MNRINVSLEILKNSNKSLLTPLQGKRKSPYSVSSINRKSKSPKLDAMVQELAKKINAESSHSKLEVTKVTPTVNEDLSEANTHTVTTEIDKVESENVGDLSKNQCNSGGTSITERNETLEQDTLSNKESIRNFQNQGTMLSSVCNISESTELKPKRERKDTKGKPKNRSWKDDDVSKAKKPRAKENVEPLQDNEPFTDVQHDKGDNLVSPLYCKQNGGISTYKPSLRGILFRKEASVKEGNFDNENKRESFHVPESQEDKRDNIFSPKRNIKERNTKRGRFNHASSYNSEGRSDPCDQNNVENSVRNTIKTKEGDFDNNYQKERETNCSGKKRGDDNQGNKHLQITGVDMSGAECDELKESMSLKTSTPVVSKINILCSDSTPITDSNAKFVADESLQGNEHYSDDSPVADLSLGEPQKHTNTGEESFQENKDTTASKEYESSDNSHYENPREIYVEEANKLEVVGLKTSDRLSRSDVSANMELLTESQREAFMITMNSQDFNDAEPFGETEPLKDQEEVDEPLEDPCFGIDCSKRECHENLLCPEPGERTGKLTTFNSPSSKISKHIHEQRQNRTARSPSPIYLSLENLVWDTDFDLGNEETENECKNLDLSLDVSYSESTEDGKSFRNPGQKSKAIKTKNKSSHCDKSPGEYLAPMENFNFDDSCVEIIGDGHSQNSGQKNEVDKASERVSAYDESDRNISIPVDLEHNICDSQTADIVEGSCRNDDSLSDSFFERAFQTYLHCSPGGAIDASVTSLITSETKRKEVISNVAGDMANTERETYQDGNKQQSCKNDTTKDAEQLITNKRLSDDMFSPSAFPDQLPNHVQTAASISAKDAKDMSSRKDNDHDEAKGKTSVAADGIISKPSTSSALPHSLSRNLDNSVLATKSFCIIDVVGNPEVFECFLKEWKEQKKFSLALACEKPPSEPSKGGIGKVWSCIQLLPSYCILFKSTPSLKCMILPCISIV